MSAIRAEIRGLNQFVRGLGTALSQWDSREAAFQKGAVDILVARARSNAASAGRIAALAARDIAARSGYLAFGGQPYDLGAEFGSYRYHQFEEWRGHGDTGGYFLWPAIREYRDQTMREDYARRVLSLLKGAFNE